LHLDAQTGWAQLELERRAVHAVQADDLGDAAWAGVDASARDAGVAGGSVDDDDLDGVALAQERGADLAGVWIVLELQACSARRDAGGGVVLGDVEVAIHRGGPADQGDHRERGAQAGGLVLGGVGIVRYGFGVEFVLG
jgi:alpha-D-ribose 1-methylphosphonate 5-triphosphate diphosphatase PhnM